MRRKLRLGVIAAGILVASSVKAAPSTLPDPASIVLPDLSLSNDPKVNENGFRYHYLHKSGVTYEQAFADYAACAKFTSHGLSSMTPVPGFTPWPDGRGKGDKPVTNAGPYGAVGYLVGQWVANIMDRDARIGVLWRCMKPRGYLRYAIPKETWAQLNDPEMGGSLAALAKAASSPTPDGAPVSQ